MHLSYDEIDFKVLSIGAFERTTVFDESGTDALYDHVGIRCTAWLNPGATSAHNFPKRPNRPEYKDPTSPAISEVELVYRLSQPRKKLKIWMDSNLKLDADDPAELILESPYTDMKTDAKFGPVCHVHGLKPDHGNGSLVVDLEFETHLAKCTDSDASAILSNRWSYKVSYDAENYAELRVFEGQAIYRVDLLLRDLDGIADNSRQFLIPPPIDGYQRQAPIFELSPGGDALRYVIIDRQVPMSFPLGNAHKAAFIKLVERRQYAQQSGNLSSLLPLEGLQDDVYNSLRQAGKDTRQWLERQFK